MLIVNISNIKYGDSYDMIQLQQNHKTKGGLTSIIKINTGIVLNMLLVSGLLLSGCNLSERSDSKSVIKDLVYNRTTDSDHTVYIDESKVSTPYLVLSDDYNGNCLLIRKNLLDETRAYNQHKPYASYYKGSEIDSFLNEVFLELLHPAVKEQVTNSIIDITQKDSLGVGGKNMTTIERKVFLLSYSELGATGSRTNLTEGRPLTYFSNNESRIAYHTDNQPGSWWLRTPNTADVDVVCGVSVNGAVGVGGLDGLDGAYLNGVRPAFCLPNSTPIFQTIIDGQKAYVLTEMR